MSVTKQHTALVDQTQTSDGQGTSTLATRNMFATVGEVGWGLGGGGASAGGSVALGGMLVAAKATKKKLFIVTSDALLHDVG